MKQTRKYLTHEQKDQIVKSFLASGLPIKDYAEKHGISEAVIYRHRKVMNGLPPRGGSKGARGSKPSPEGKFIPFMHSADVSPGHLNGHICLEMNGIKATVSADNREGVKLALQVLKGEI